MRKTKTLSKILSVLIITTVAIIGARLLIGAHAQTLAINVDMNWIDGASSCFGTANGQTDAYYGAIKGDTVNVHISNVSAYSIDVTAYGVSSGGIKYTVPSGNSIDKTWTVNSEITLENDGGPCTSGHGGPGVFYIKSASGSLNCNLTSNQVWDIQIGYFSTTGNTSLYRGSTYVQKFSTGGNNIISSAQFAATTSATTYKLYYGSNKSARLLGQTTCPAKSVATSELSSSSSSSSGSGSSTPTTITPDKTTNPKNSTSTSSTSKVNDSPTATDASSTPASSQDSDTKKSFNLKWLTLPVIGLPLITFGLIKYYPNLRKALKKKR